MTDQATGAPTTPVPEVTVVDPDDWSGVAAAIQQHTGQPPTCDLASLATFVGGCVAAMVDADTGANPGLLRGRFSDVVIGQLTKFGGQLAGRAVRTVSLQLLGAPESANPPVVRSRVNVEAVAPSGDAERHDGFWDVRLSPSQVVVGVPKCPCCGAGLEQGSLVCPYCHADTRAAADVALLVVKMERLS